MQKIICGHERKPKKSADHMKGQGYDEPQGHHESEGHEGQDHEGDGHPEASSTVNPEISVSENHHRSKRSPDSLTESLAQSFNFGKISLFSEMRICISILGVEFNPYLMYGFSHHYQLCESTFIFRGVRSDFYLIFQ